MGRTKDLFNEYREGIAYQADRVENGELGVLDALLFMRENKALLKDTIDLIDAWEADVQDEIIAEAENHKDGYKGFDINVRNGSRRFSFKNIPEWQDIEKLKKDVEAKYKSMFLARENGAVHANVSEDGEELPLPDISYTKSSIVLKPLKR